jgi:hypothetical protein
MYLESDVNYCQESFEERYAVDAAWNPMALYYNHVELMELNKAAAGAGDRSLENLMERCNKAADAGYHYLAVLMEQQS